MFCEECGAKNESGAAFCAECGHKFKVEKRPKKSAKEKSEEVIEQPKEEKPAKVKKPMSKGKKFLIGFILVVVAALIGGYMYISSTLKPEKIALKYFKAYANNDVDTICDLISLDDSEFVSKKLLKEGFKSKEKIKLKNYSAKEEDSNGLTTTVTITYIKEGSSKERTYRVKLIKDKKKKWLFFTNWMVDNSELVVEDYNLYVPTGTTAYINNVEVKTKYMNDSSSSSYDTYTIPSILKGDYTISAKLKSGLTLSAKTTIKDNYSSLSSSSLKFDEKSKEKLTKDIKEKINTIYSSVMEDKSFDDIKSVFSGIDDFENTFDGLKRYIMTEYNKLTKLEVTDIKITSYSIYNNELRLTVQMKYNYTVEYKSGDEVEEVSKKNQTDTFYVDYNIKKKDLKMSDISGLVSYFSHYSY